MTSIELSWQICKKNMNDINNHKQFLFSQPLIKHKKNEDFFFLINEQEKILIMKIPFINDWRKGCYRTFFRFLKSSKDENWSLTKLVGLIFTIIYAWNHQHTIRKTSFVVNFTSTPIIKNDVRFDYRSDELFIVIFFDMLKFLGSWMEKMNDSNVMK